MRNPNHRNPHTSPIEITRIGSLSSSPDPTDYVTGSVKPLLQRGAQKESAPGNGMEGIGPVGVPPTHQSATGRCACRRNMEIGKADRLVIERVDVGRFHNRITVAGEVAIALVIGDHDDQRSVGPRHSRTGPTVSPKIAPRGRLRSGSSVAQVACFLGDPRQRGSRGHSKEASL